MASTNAHGFGRLPLEIVFVASAAASIALVTGHPAIAETLGGGVLVACALRLGWKLMSRAVHEADSGERLAVDLSLVLVVLVFLAGVTLMGLALPNLD